MEGDLMSTSASAIMENRKEWNPKLALLTVLITEDNLILQSIAKRFFIRAGISEKNITIAENGKEAVGLVEANPEGFDIIYMDEKMPIMEGPEATLKIREIETSRKSKSIIFTCSASYEGVFPGANVRLDKPLNFNALSKFLEKVTQDPSYFCNLQVLGHFESENQKKTITINITS
jgi:CheY-like chemotaxis protein